MAQDVSKPGGLDTLRQQLLGSGQLPAGPETDQSYTPVAPPIDQPDSGTQFVDPSKPQPAAPLSEDQQLLYGDVNNTQPDIANMQMQASAQVHSKEMPVPTKLLRTLPYMKIIANDPNTPATVRDFYRATVLSIEQRMKNGG